MTTIGEKLRTFRKLQGKTQPEIGALLRVPQATISKWEKGVQQPSAQHVAQLAELMGEGVASLLGILDRQEGFGEMKQSDFSPHEAQQNPSRREKKPGRHPAWGAMKGMITLLPDVDLTAPAYGDWKKLYGEDK